MRRPPGFSRAPLSFPSALPGVGTTASAFQFSPSPQRTGHPLVSVAGAGTVYRRRQPTATPLYPVVQHHLETFLARAEALGDTVPHWVEDDFRAYLACGILAHGFARARCGDCGTERLVAFSCKGRGVCPSCNARRMVEVAAHLNDPVLPPLPVRQWVFSLPKRLRPFLPHDPALTGAVLGVLLRAIRALLLKNSPGAPEDARIGAISFPHRFGSSLNAHFHFHVVVLDGLFSEDAGGAVQFHRASDPGSRDLQRLQQTLRRRTLRLFLRRGLLDEPAVENMLTWQAAGGFSLDASVRIAGHDHAGRERLLRYCARPPFALERLHLERAQRGTSPKDTAAPADHIPHVLYRPARRRRFPPTSSRRSPARAPPAPAGPVCSPASTKSCRSAAPIAVPR
jgi:hypothetical protein